MNDNEEMLAGYVNASYPDAILMLLNLNIHIMLILMLIYVSELCSCAVRILLGYTCSHEEFSVNLILFSIYFLYMIFEISYQ